MIFELFIISAFISLLQGLTHLVRNSGSFIISVIRDLGLLILILPFVIWYYSIFWLGLLCFIINFICFTLGVEYATLKDINKNKDIK